MNETLGRYDSRCMVVRVIKIAKWNLQLEKQN